MCCTRLILSILQLHQIQNSLMTNQKKDMQKEIYRLHPCMMLDQILILF